MLRNLVPLRVGMGHWLSLGNSKRKLGIRSESPRLSRRLQTLRGWSHEQQIDEVRTRGA